MAEMDNFTTVNVSKKTPAVLPLDAVPTLDPRALDAASVRAAEEFVAEGTPANTARSYASALRYWAAWYALRYGQALGDGPLPVAVATQFVLDHLERQTKAGLAHELPPALDARLVELGAKARPGPLAYGTVSHRLAVLAKWHRLHGWDSPTDDHRLKTLLAKARKAQARRGVAVRKKTAAVAEPLQAMLATCTDGHRGLRDRALLLLAWSGGGRRRSEVVNLQVTDLRPLDATTWVYALGSTKTDTSGVRREKPLKGDVVVALQGRARLAGLAGDWAAHSLRSGFITEAGRQGVPLGEVMALTEHRSLGTVMGYFQAGTLLSSRGTDLLGARPDTGREPKTPK